MVEINMAIPMESSGNTEASVVTPEESATTLAAMPAVDPDEDDDEYEEDGEDDEEVSLSLVIDALHELKDKITGRQAVLGGDDFKKKIEQRSGTVTRAELRDWIYAILLELTGYCGVTVLAVDDQNDSIDEIKAVVAQQGLLLDSLISGSVISIAAQLAKLVMARIKDDNEMLTLAQSILQAIQQMQAQQQITTEPTTSVSPTTIAPASTEVKQDA